MKLVFLLVLTGFLTGFPMFYRVFLGFYLVSLGFLTDGACRPSSPAQPDQLSQLKNQFLTRKLVFELKNLNSVS